MLCIQPLGAQHLGADLHKISAIIKNVGYLPTHMTQRAFVHHMAASVKVGISDCGMVSERAWIVGEVVIVSPTAPSCAGR